MSDSPSELKVVSATQARVIGTCGGVCISIFQGPSTIDDIRLVGQTMEQLRRLRGNRFGYLNILGPMTSLPSAQMRQASKELMDRIRPHVVGLAFIAEGDGFWQNIVRSMMRGMSMFQDPKPIIFATIREGADWLALAMNKAGAPIDAIALTKGTEALRSQMSSSTYAHA